MARSSEREPPRPQRSDTVIRSSTVEHNDGFMKRRWPEYDRPLGIQWREQHGHLRAESDSGTTVGVANYVIVGGLGELRQILVGEPWARQGIGSSLLTAFEAICRDRGCHKLRLETGDYQARGFYERHGWQVAATLRRDRFERTWFIMEKVIAS